jgi:hypothetical protein
MDFVPRKWEAPVARRQSLQDKVRPVIDRFVAQMARVLERHATQELKRRVLAEVRARNGGRGPRARASARCYFPGCTNVAAPRFGMFCAALHKGLSPAQKARYRAQRLAK